MPEPDKKPTDEESAQLEELEQRERAKDREKEQRGPTNRGVEARPMSYNRAL